MWPYKQIDMSDVVVLKTKLDDCSDLLSFKFLGQGEKLL